MFHLQERQLHIILGLMLGTSVLLFCVMALPQRDNARKEHRIKTMTDYSEAWICNYKTNNREKLEEYLDEEKIEKGENRIREVVTLPASLPVAAGEVLTMANKLPAIMDSDLYMVMETKKQNVTVYAGEDCLYKSSEKDSNMSAYHVILIPAQYQNTQLTVELQSGHPGNDESNMRAERIQYGNYGELLAEAALENGVYVLSAVLILLFSVCMLVFWMFIVNKGYQKRILFYTGLEGIGLSLGFLLESRIFQVITGWNYSLQFARACVILLAAVLHLLLVRCFIYKKKVLFLVDMGILFYGVCYVAFMVLQGFSLISFENVYRIGTGMFGIFILLCTVALIVTVYDYGRKEGRLVLFGNGILLLSMLVQFISWVMNKDNMTNVYLPAGFLVYLVVIGGYGLKKAAYLDKPVETGEKNDEALRAEILDQINPNLIFASFHMLQRMIKNGSENSVKMIYYISVYFRDNLRAVEQAGSVVDFSEELEHIIAYLQLQRTRNHSLSFSLECKVQDFKVVRHSIEPIVENAVKHGIAGTENGGSVVVRSYRREDGYAVQVIDNGSGFDKSILRRKSRTSLLRIFDELKTACGAQTEIISKEGQGTVITIIFPMLENELLDEE